MSSMEELAAQWMYCKQQEAEMVKARRELEDVMRAMVGISEDNEGTTTVSPPGFKIKVVGRIDRKVDADIVQELAAEHGLTDHLSSLFRWKPEINMKAWNAAEPSITKALSGAITAKPGRPSFTIEAI